MPGRLHCVNCHRGPLKVSSRGLQPLLQWHHDHLLQLHLPSKEPEEYFQRTETEQVGTDITALQSFTYFIYLVVSVALGCKRSRYTVSGKDQFMIWATYQWPLLGPPEYWPLPGTSLVWMLTALKLLSFFFWGILLMLAHGISSSAIFLISYSIVYDCGIALLNFQEFQLSRKYWRFALFKNWWVNSLKTWS